MEVTPHDPNTLPYEMLKGHDADWHAGSAEPWVRDTLVALLVANGTRRAIEIGGFQGYTSVALAEALDSAPWPTRFTVCDIDPERAARVRTALGLDRRCVTDVVVSDSLAWIPTLSDASVDFVWLDGNHEKLHVLQELTLLLSKMAPGGMICGHDVFGVCDLQDVFAYVARQCGWPSMSLDLPRLGPAGGIGILQRPR